MKDTKKIYKSLVFLKILAKPIYFIRESKTNDKILIRKSILLSRGGFEKLLLIKSEQIKYLGFLELHKNF